jgi:ABC-type dipeptide/oligopeptide/nickel transport system permease subunit
MGASSSGSSPQKTEETKRRRNATQAAVTWRRFRRNKSALIGLAIVGAFILLGAFGPLFAPYPPRSTALLFLGQAHQPPSWAHPFGTEPTGVDVFSDSIWGTRNDLYVGLVATFIATVLGVAIGAIAGYARSSISAVILAIIQVFFVIPTLLLILLFARLFQPLVIAGFGLTLIVLILGLFGWSGIAFVVRGEIFRVKELEFVQAEKALGATNFRILFRHIVPNILTPVIVLATLGIAGNIITEVIISFLGFGDPNTATWGLIINDGFRYVSVYWWVSFFPGLMTVILVLGFNLLGDGLSDALNPRLRE